MKKRNSKRQIQFQTIRQQNYSITTNSPLKNNLIRDTTVINFKKQKYSIELPKIFPINNIIKHKRYIQNNKDNQIYLNLIGTNFIKTISRQKNINDDKINNKQQKNRQKQQSYKKIFLQNILYDNNINKIIYIKKQKLKVFIDDGNNSRLIKQLIRKRNNLKIINNKKDANIVWTQFCDWQIANMGTNYMQTNKQIESTLIYEEKINNTKNCYTQQISIKQKRYKQIIINELKMHNHFKNHYQLSDKKCLFKNIKKYCKHQKIDQRQIIPKTFHIDQENQLPQNICQKQMLWIVKPGQDTNRGNGITVQQGRQNILKAIKQLQLFGKSSLVQQYINPLLYRNRKFDIRCYVLVTSICGNLKAYWYKQGYLRTCSRQFTYDPSNIYGHLTNDAIQKKYKDYGKYEPYNKLSFNDLQIFLRSKQINYELIYNRMKQLALLSIRSVQNKLCGQKNIFCFQIFGYDFLIDNLGKVWLIQINTNPCLQFSGSLLSRIIWHMVQNSLAIVIDPLLISIPQGYISYRQKLDKIYLDNKFECMI